MKFDPRETVSKKTSLYNENLFKVFKRRFYKYEGVDH